MGKENVVRINIYIHAQICTYNEIVSSPIKKEILPFAMTWIDLEGTMLSG